MAEAKENFAAGETVTAAQLNVIAKNADDGGGFRDDLLLGETFTGATTPQPAYISTSDSRLYRADANVSTKIDFVGFVLNSGAAGAAGYLQSNGIVRGFTGLTIGGEYYVQDAVGTIGLTLGTYAVPVGVAISATELLIYNNDKNLISEVIVSDNLKESANTERSIGDDVDTKYKEIKVRVNGTIRVKFDLKDPENLGNGTARIYKNGSAFGTARTGSTNYQTFSEDLAFVKDDLVQLYGKQIGGQPEFVRNFRLYYDKVKLPDTVVNQD